MTDITAKGLLSLNILNFARLLRRAGLPIGPADMLAAQEAMTRIEIGRRDQVKTALRTTMVHRHEHQDIFDQAFKLYWRAADNNEVLEILDKLAGPKPPPEKAPRADRY